MKHSKPSILSIQDVLIPNKLDNDLLNVISSGLGGLYGFYPPPDKIEEYADVNTEANIRMAWFAGALYRAQVTQYKATQVTPSLRGRAHGA